MNALLNRVFGRTSPSLGEDYPAIKAHVLKRIADTAVGENPFYHLYIESLFPEDFYTAMFDYKQALKVSGQMIARNQDNAAFQNRRYPLADDHTQAVRQFRALWDDFDVRKAVLEKFYIAPNDAFCDSVRIHEKEFEFVFCEEGRFQNIHVDIPQKFLSFVFYFPEIGMDEQDEKANATILYNRELEPVYGARFRANSVCVFAPPSVSASTTWPVAPFTRFGPPSPMNDVPSTIRITSESAGKYAPPAMHGPMTAAICGTRRYRRMIEL